MCRLIIIFIMALLLTNCKKERGNSNCAVLKEGVVSNNLQQVTLAISSFMNDLPSADYTEANISKLASIISGSCAINAGTYCFDCIQTLPSQTEIWIEVRSGSSTIRKTIDLTYTAGSNKLKFGNMHD